MYDVPGREDITEVVVDRDVIFSDKKPVYVLTDEKDKKKSKKSEAKDSKDDSKKKADGK